MITATVNGELTGAAFAGVVKSIIVNANDGDDKVSVDPKITAPVKLFGGRGADDLQGGGGDNRLDGGPGQDTLRSREGVRDVFVLTAGQGTDTVKGFEEGTDKVELSGDLVFTDVAVSQVGKDTVLSVDRPTLVGRTVLPADSFVDGADVPTSGQFITAGQRPDAAVLPPPAAAGLLGHPAPGRRQLPDHVRQRLRGQGQLGRLRAAGGPARAELPDGRRRQRTTLDPARSSSCAIPTTR